MESGSNIEEEHSTGGLATGRSISCKDLSNTKPKGKELKLSKSILSLLPEFATGVANWVLVPLVALIVPIVVCLIITAT